MTFVFLDDGCYSIHEENWQEQRLYRFLCVAEIMKCCSCGEKIEETFLEKVKGTYLVKGKKKVTVCSTCQGKYTAERLRKKFLKE